MVRGREGFAYLTSDSHTKRRRVERRCSRVSDRPLQRGLGRCRLLEITAGAWQLPHSTDRRWSLNCGIGSMRARISVSVQRRRFDPHGRRRTDVAGCQSVRINLVELNRVAAPPRTMGIVRRVKGRSGRFLKGVGGGRAARGPRVRPSWGAGALRDGHVGRGSGWAGRPVPGRAVARERVGATGWRRPTSWGQDVSGPTGTGRRASGERISTCQ